MQICVLFAEFEYVVEIGLPVVFDESENGPSSSSMKYSLLNEKNRIKLCMSQSRYSLVWRTTSFIQVFDRVQGCIH